MGYRGLVIILCCVLLMPMVSAQLGNFSCVVRATSCNAGEVAVLGLTATTNSHAALPAPPSNHKVCCSGPSGLIANAGGANYLDMNAFGHVEKTDQLNYAIDLEIDADPGLECTYQTNPSGSTCSDRHSCVLSIDQNSNAHIGDCSEYNEKVCCRCIEAVEPQALCADGIDNDCDGLVDCDDPDCLAQVEGYVHGYLEGNGTFPLFEASVESFKGVTKVSSTTTAENGSYSFNAACGNANIVASKVAYAPSTRQVQLSTSALNEVNFTKNQSLVYADDCEADCTLNTDDFMKSYCDTVNDCAFYDSIHAAACHETEYRDVAGFTPWVREYDINNWIECRPGATPYLKAGATVQASVQCPAGTTAQAVSQSIARIGGQGVNVNMIVCVE